MKRLLVLLLAVGAGVVLGRKFDGVSSTAEAAGGGGGGGLEKCAAKNGDVNADGRVDLSDAVTILGHLFLGSPSDLVGLCDAPPAASGLPYTGQNVCYGFVENAGWQEVPCDQVSCRGQDAQYATGCPSEGRFTDNGDGTVTDHCTGLMWQKDTADVNGDGQIPHDGSDAVPWCDALAYCENLSYAGRDDWRLPNVRELQSIVDYGRKAPAIDPVFGASWYVYWSSTSYGGSAWGVLFRNGSVSFHDEFVGFIDGNASPNYVRAVRNGT